MNVEGSSKAGSKDKDGLTPKELRKEVLNEDENIKTSREKTIDVYKKVTGDYQGYSALLKIQSGGKLVGLRFNRVQQTLYKIIKIVEKQKRLGRFVILKARQEGISTFIAGYCYKECSTNPNRNAMLVAHESNAAEYIFTMIKTMHTFMDERIKVETQLSNRKELFFDNKKGTGLKSRISIGVATNEIGLGQEISFLHLSEVARFPGSVADEIMDGVSQTVHNYPHTKIFLESTAKGVGGMFYKKYWGSRYFYFITLKSNGNLLIQERINKNADINNEYSSIFLPWFLMGEYTDIVPTGFIRNKEENDLVKLYGLSDGQLQWRRRTIANQCSGNVETFYQEYPGNPEEAFRTSGRFVFDNPRLRVLQKTLKEAGRRYECKTSNGVWIVEETGRFKVWEEPVEGQQYIIGADVAEGLIHGDFSCADVINRLTGEQVAHWHGKIAPDQFGRLLYWIGERYNTALVVPERNNHGGTTIAVLNSMGYKNIYIELRTTQPAMLAGKKFGFLTNRASKPMIIDALSALVRENCTGINNYDTINEMLTFIIDTDGRLTAEQEHNDDRVMSYAIAQYIRGISPLRDIKEQNRIYRPSQEILTIKNLGAFI